MIILIDAYNVLKTVLHVQFISDAQRKEFLKLFERYVQCRPSNQIILVFDGGQDMYEAEKKYDRITVCYAGALQIADDVIQKKLQTLREYDVLLVTCDRQLRNYAARLQIESLGSVEFYNMIKEVVHQTFTKEVIIAQKICKTSLEENDDLDMLMELASRNLVVKDQDKFIKVVMRKSDSMASGKKDKKLMKKIAKI